MIKLAALLALVCTSFLQATTQPHDLDAPSIDITPPSYETTFLKMLLVVALLLLLAALAVYLIKTFSQSRLKQENHFKNIKILEKRAISPKSILYLVEIGGKKILIGESQLELRELSHLDWVEIEKKGV